MSRQKTSTTIANEHNTVTKQHKVANTDNNFKSKYFLKNNNPNIIFQQHQNKPINNIKQKTIGNNQEI